MSVSSGTAASYTDLLAKLVTFLTTTGSGNPGWTLLGSNTSSPYTYTEPGGGGAVSTIVDEYYLEAPGLSGSEQIYINIHAFYDTALGTFNWRMKGATGYNSSATFFAQPGTSPDTFLHLWNNSIPYTFVANGQRVIVIAQVGTVYETCYLGKFNPVGAPAQYPYPLFIGGTSITATLPYSNSTPSHHAFFDPQTAYVYWIDGSWQPFQNHNSADSIMAVENVWPWAFGLSSYSPSELLPNLDGSYPLFRATLEMTTPAGNVLGFLDGVFYAPGTSLASGSTITIAGQTYMAVQDVYRTATNNFAAILQV
jgi:hypothetical protein